DLLEDAQFDLRHRGRNRDALRAEIQPWYAAHTKREIFTAALDDGWAAAMVMTAGDALDDPHLTERGFLGPSPTEPKATIPVRPWLATPSRRAANSAPDFAMPDLAGVRVIEMTWAWAGPFVGRFLGAFGADVVRIEAGRWPDGSRGRPKWKDAGVTIPDGVDPDEITYDAAALFNNIN